jgi:RNA polymerase-binding transcription factor DksA
VPKPMPARVRASNGAPAPPAVKLHSPVGQPLKLPWLKSRSITTRSPGSRIHPGKHVVARMAHWKTTGSADHRAPEIQDGGDKENTMTARQINTFRRLLEAEQSDLIERIHRMRDRLAISEPGDALDRVRSINERESAARDLAFEACLLKSVQEALKEIRAVTFGRCVACEGEIRCGDWRRCRGRRIASDVRKGLKVERRWKPRLKRSTMPRPDEGQLSGADPTRRCGAWRAQRRNR